MARNQFTVESRWGGSEPSPTTERMRELVAALDVRDEEHPDTWLIHEPSGWSLRLDEDGFAYLTNPDCGIVAHLTDVSRDRGLGLWLRFAEAGREGVLAEPWIQGRPYISPEETAARNARMQESVLEGDRAFYALLGDERPTVACRASGCARGAIEQSVFCRIHHFQQVLGRECPFSD